MGVSSAAAAEAARPVPTGEGGARGLPPSPGWCGCWRPKAASERDAATRALAAVLEASSACCKAFQKDERGVVNAVQLLGDGFGSGLGVEESMRFSVSVLLAAAQSRRCRKQMVAAGARGFLQGLVAAEVEGAKRLAECLGKGKMLGVFPRS